MSACVHVGWVEGDVWMFLYKTVQFFFFSGGIQKQCLLCIWCDCII